MKIFLGLLLMFLLSSCELKNTPQNEFPYGETLSVQPGWEIGTWAFEGDSNVQYTNVKTWYGEKAFNTAIAGSRTDHVISRIPQVALRKPERIIIQIGGNDVLQLVPIDTIVSNLKTIIWSYKKITPHIYIVGIPYINPELSPSTILNKSSNTNINELGLVKELEKKLTLPTIHYVDLVLITNLAILKLCQEMGVPYIDIFYVLKKDYNKYQKDQVHYNNYGRKAVADQILPIISK